MLCEQHQAPGSNMLKSQSLNSRRWSLHHFTLVLQSTIAIAIVLDVTTIVIRAINVIASAIATHQSNPQRAKHPLMTPNPGQPVEQEPSQPRALGRENSRAPEVPDSCFASGARFQRQSFLRSLLMNPKEQVQSEGLESQSHGLS